MAEPVDLAAALARAGDAPESVARVCADMAAMAAEVETLRARVADLTAQLAGADHLLGRYAAPEGAESW